MRRSDGNNIEFDSRVNLMMNRLQTLQDKQHKINQKQQETCEKLTDIQWRSTRDNLIFSGIPEGRQFREKGGFARKWFKTSIITELQIPEQISIYRAHRLGRSNPRHTYPRPIVAKFKYFKDKESVREAAPKKPGHTYLGKRAVSPQNGSEKKTVIWTC